MSDTFTVLRDCLVEEFDVPAALVTPGATLASLDLDSLALVELSLLVEERIGATVSDIRPDSTLGGLVAHADGVLAETATAEAEAETATATATATAAVPPAGAVPAPGGAPLTGADLAAGAVS
ncbi:acyl carrier protein [Kitasatospora sp. NBC_00458]|uniref:acyl carrier protein n=1 Tax=Kitasatospora sp. NBC_00458 TaxID=2903568 RepID=UPI002E198A38